ncbi:MAG: DNA polymerase III subunit chi [Gammaproteobacteria bacterium]|nr:DNA polymerase III subunit chi [Gammaproteobacteria bacterium]
MTKIDFYVLPDTGTETRLELVCKLAEKAVQRDKSVFIHASDESILTHLDTLLWNFRADSFVPHRVMPANEPNNALDNDPVLLSTGAPGADRRVLINLADDVPPFFSRFERTLEVVSQAEEVRETGRARYRFYKQRGYPLQHHKM